HVRAYRGEFLANLGAQILVDLYDLQLDLGDLVLVLRGRGDELPAVAVSLGEVALQAHNPGKLHEVFLPESHDALQLLANPFDLIFLGSLLRNQSGDLLPKLSDALIKLRLLTFARLSPD